MDKIHITYLLVRHAHEFIPMIVGVFCFRHLNLFLKLTYIFLVVAFVALFFQPSLSPGQVMTDDMMMYFPDNQKHFAYMAPKNKWDTAIPVMIGMFGTCFFAWLLLKEKETKLFVFTLLLAFIAFVFLYTIYEVDIIFPTHLYRILMDIVTVIIYVVMLYSCVQQFLASGKYPPEVYLIIGAILSCSGSLPSVCLEWYTYRNDFLNILQDILQWISSILLATSFWMSRPKNTLYLFYRTKILRG